MNKIIFTLLLVASLLPITAYSDTVSVQNFEGEIILGMSSPFKKLKGFENCGAIDGGVELRYNLKKVPVGVGIMVRDYNPGRTEREGYSGPGGSWGGLLMGATGEYNFRRGRNCNPFVGVGIGAVDLDAGFVEEGVRPFFRPKIGVELFHHFRINASVTVVSRESTGWSVSIGWVIGGSPRRDK